MWATLYNERYRNNYAPLGNLSGSFLLHGADAQVLLVSLVCVQTLLTTDLLHSNSNVSRLGRILAVLPSTRYDVHVKNENKKDRGTNSTARQTSSPPYDVYQAKCPTREALNRIADKWTALIIGLLEQRPHRFGELKRGIGGISHKVLTQTLRGLEADGLVARVILSPRPLSVEYSLTPLGRTLISPLQAIRSWAESHIDSVLQARAEGRGTRTNLPAAR
jgi:DNA-binding HxlR family transcriptional regulator